MATEKISGFEIKSYEALDTRIVVSDKSTIAYPYVGMHVVESGSFKQYKYVGTPPSNTPSDWQRISATLVNSGVPDNSIGADDDIYVDSATNFMYFKVAGSWTLLTDLTGAQIFTGSDVPSNGTGVDGDMYFRHTGDVYQKASGVWGSVLFNLKGANGQDGDKYSTVSSTSVNIPTTHPTAVSLTVATGLAYSTGQNVVAAEVSSGDYFIGDVASYNSGTGQLIINSTSHSGTGAIPTTSWTVNLNTAAGLEGATGKPGVPDRTYNGDVSNVFDETEITSIEADSQWTPTNLFIAYLIADDRFNKNAPAGISGDKTGNIVTWNGSVWVDLGRIRGYDGTAGNNGWSPVLSITTKSSTESVLKLVGWQGGTGGLPASLSAVIGYYIGSTGLVSSIASASNIKGPTGAQGDPGDLTSVTTMVSGGSTNMNHGRFIVPTPTPDLVQYNAFRSTYTTVGTTYPVEMSWSNTHTLGDELFIEASVAALVDNAAGTSLTNYSDVTVELIASNDATFTTNTSSYGRVKLSTRVYRIYNPNCKEMSVKTAWKVPVGGTWYYRLELTPAVKAIKPSFGGYGSQYIIIELNKTGTA